MANVLKDAKVGFLTGLQKSVDTMLSQGANAGAKHGYFYLTKDSHRLYVGNSDGSLSAVNEGVQTVTYLNDLPVLSSADDKVAYTGRFFYVQYKDSSAGQVASNVANILCVYNGSSWVQINANTNTLVKSTEFAATAAGQVATIKNTITDTDGAKKTGDFTITGAGGLKIAASGKNVTITGDKYTLSAADGASREVKLNLTSANGQGTTAVTLKSDPETTTLDRDGNTITIRGRANNKVTIANGDSSGFKVSVTDTEGKVVTGTYDPVIKYGGSGGSTAKLEKGVFTLSAYNKAEVDQLLRDLDAMEYRGTVGKDGSAATTWDACTKLRQKIGYTYLFSSAITVPSGIQYSKGSLAIARGTEYTPADLTSGVITDSSLVGTITPNTLTWDFVESTVDTDTTYRLVTNGEGVGFALRDSQGGLQGEIKYVGKNGLTITESQTGASTELKGLTNTITVTHDNVSRVNTAQGPDAKSTAAPTNAKAQLSSSTPSNYVNDTLTIPVITSITTNAQGHVTGVNTVNYQLNDTGTCITDLKQTATAASNKATVKTVISAKNVAGKNMVVQGTATSTFSTSSLTIGASGSNVSIDMTWGEF